jgi:hypothetical protein
MTQTVLEEKKKVQISSQLNVLKISMQINHKNLETEVQL